MKKPGERPLIEISADERARFLRFVQEAFFIDGEIDIGASMRLHRWERPVRVGVVGADPETTRRIEDRVQMIRRLTGLAIELGPGDRPLEFGEILIEVGPRAELDPQEDPRIFSQTPCFARVSTKTPGEGGPITKARAVVTTDDATIIGHCLSQEIAHAFGLTGDGRFAVKSAFGVSPPHGGGYGAWDRLAFWAVYHPDLHAGMRWDQAAPIIARLIAEAPSRP